MAPILAVRQLEKVIEQRSALAVEQFDVNASEIVAVVGPAGSGKSLLIRLLSGELPPSGGTILIEGQDLPRARARLGVLFEQDLLYERHSAQANLEFFCRLHGLPARRAGEVLALVGLSDQRRERAARLSPSAQRRLAFARLLARATPLWLLDAPTLRADLDTQSLFARLAPGRVASGAAEAGLPAAPARLVPYKVPARMDDRIVFYDPGELLYAASQESKTILRSASEEAVTHLTLHDLESRLAGRGFFRAHRAYLVNLQHIKAVVQFTRNSYALLLDDAAETSIPLSKQSEKELQELLGY